MYRICILSTANSSGTIQQNASLFKENIGISGVLERSVVEAVYPKSKEVIINLELNEY